MKNRLNHKLYNKYYPIKNEDEKRLFLDNDRHSLEVSLRMVMYKYESSFVELLNSYINKTKEPVFVFGNIKYDNIMHNRRVVSEMEHDSRINIYKHKTDDAASVLRDITICKNLSIDEINNALELINNNKHREINFYLMRIFILIAVFMVLNYIF